ncbi:polyprenol monophosphomannose synthase [Solirubrobacter sp. CPCC 204708]|uniref:Polyprenol monophosphomannose synthase n=1 Tax=Solirubrobacter deserti TaxID=2282478 RepID=A0ABT4RBP9_9ACTN|nr:polyprenol monophosphomannose synthase [Solirubrobacter deserti]MBE2317147.1 polyprenol monophosphomannose synthase [Solirubrobacter deserti]MDA0135960.1 polyprenol monophosphomannose synthase [Solirubrobacter deserti]
MDGSVWVILPTYDEADNLEAVVGGIRAAMPAARVLVVDDNSPDGTGRLADQMASADAALHVLHRAGKSGLGRAYMAGFEHALAHGAGYVVEMDADLSHDPADLPRLVAPAVDGADLVLGSRYTSGGGIENWGLDRRVLSRLGCGYARRVLSVPVRDLTGGFKCFRASALQAIDAGSAGAHGYAFQVELTYRVLSLGLRVVEVPIRFRERRLGESKMSARIALEAAWRVPALRFGPRRWYPPLEIEPRSADPLVNEG